MSVSTPATPRSRYAEPINGVPAAPSSRPSGWLRLVVVAAILAASGGARLWQERRIERVLEIGRTSPFPLASLPMRIGSWEGSSATMDPKIVRITGSTDLVARRYIDRRTRVGLDVIVLYGPTSDMIFHMPEVCYPSAGFAMMPGVFDRSIVVDRPGLASITVPFRALAYTKGEGGLADSQEVYYSLRYDGRWSNQTASHKASKRIPGMYKIQLSRRISDRGKCARSKAPASRSWRPWSARSRPDWSVIVPSRRRSIEIMTEVDVVDGAQRLDALTRVEAIRQGCTR